LPLPSCVPVIVAVTVGGMVSPVPPSTVNSPAIVLWPGIVQK
jgi:hypothetical protein